MVNLKIYLGVSMMRHKQRGFTIAEILVATVILPLLLIAISQLFNLIRTQYGYARQYNEVYAVLSACPELDRALQYEILTGSTNCFPNNVFDAEGGGTGTITYAPTLTVTDTSALPVSDALRTVPDSKVVDLSLNITQNSTAIPMKLRLLVTRSGIGQQ
jgi:prepilin-type N-terminal cleavage/methylation domain-containing protein